MLKLFLLTVCLFSYSTHSKEMNLFDFSFLEKKEYPQENVYSVERYLQREKLNQYLKRFLNRRCEELPRKKVELKGKRYREYLYDFLKSSAKETAKRVAKGDKSVVVGYKFEEEGKKRVDWLGYAYKGIREEIARIEGTAAFQKDDYLKQSHLFELNMARTKAAKKEYGRILDLYLDPKNCLRLIRFSGGIWLKMPGKRYFTSLDENLNERTIIF